MNRALQARLAKLEPARGQRSEFDGRTSEQLEASIRAIVKEIGGLDATLAHLDDLPEGRRLRQLIDELPEFCASLREEANGAR